MQKRDKPEEESNLTSQFNEAGHQISRLHNIWLDCRQFREKGFIIKYKFALESAEIELNDDAEKHKYLEDIQDLNNKIDSLDLLILIRPELKFILQRKLYFSLCKKEKLLRKVQDASGKGGKFIDPEEKIEI